MMWPLLVLLPLLLQGQFNYTTENGQAVITGYTGDGGVVVIPESIDGLPVKRIGVGAFHDCTNVLSVIIANSVTTLSESAFSGCSGLIGVTVPDSVINIGQGAFAGCVSLSRITIPDGVTDVGPFAFSGCSILQRLTIPAAVERIGESAFAPCTSLTGIDVDPGNKFYSSLQGVLFDKSQNSLIQYPGANGEAYDVPNAVIRIKDYAFYQCTRLARVSISGSVTEIGTGSFMGCSRLSSITIPDSVTRLGEGAFRSCTHLLKVSIPRNITWMGSRLFQDCVALAHVSTDEGLNIIGSMMFQNCTSLSSIAIPSSVTQIGEWAFHRCTRLSSVRIPGGVETIGKLAFGRCTELTEITVDPANPFYSGLDGVLFDKERTQIIQCPGGKRGRYAIPPEVQSIGGGSFSGCEGLTEISIPASVTNIDTVYFYFDGGSPFAGCAALRTIRVDERNKDYTSVDGVLFTGDLTKIIRCPQTRAGNLTIPEWVVQVSSATFEGCSQLVSLTLLGDVPRFGFQAFAGCSNLLSLYVLGNAPSEDVSWQSPAINYYLPGTFGWGATNGGRPSLPWVLPSPMILKSPESYGLAAEGFGFIVVWARNASVVIESAPRVDGPTWSPASTNFLEAGWCRFTDPDSRNRPARFYRIRPR